MKLDTMLFSDLHSFISTIVLVVGERSQRTLHCLQYPHKMHLLCLTRHHSSSSFFKPSSPPIFSSSIFCCLWSSSPSSTRRPSLHAVSTTHPGLWCSPTTTWSREEEDLLKIYMVDQHCHWCCCCCYEVYFMEFASQCLVVSVQTYRIQHALY